jgi:hypothetical protein
MARALSVHRSIIPAPERARYLERLRLRKEHYVRSHCKFWVFEEVALAGAFIEFTEASEPSALSAAHAAAPEPVLDPARIYTEVELT